MASTTMVLRTAGRRVLAAPVFRRSPSRPLALMSVRYASSSTHADPKAKANALIDALPGNSLVSKTGWITLTTALTGAAISKELFVLNEEVVVLGSFIILVGYIASVVREPYREWADGQIQKVKDILSTSRAAHTSAVKERIASVDEMKDVESLTKQLFEISKETAKIEYETFGLRQKAAIAADVKSVLDSWVRHEAQVREAEQRELVDTVLSNVQKQLADKKLQRDILVSAVADIEALVKSKTI